MAYYKNPGYAGENAVYLGTEQYECPQCKTEWDGDPGPQRCPRCSNNIITWKTFKDWVFEGIWKRKTLTS